MSKITNPVIEEIYEMIVNDIRYSNEDYSTLTNVEIYNLLSKEVSPFSVRDHVLLLSKQGYLQRVNNYWDQYGQFHNRVLFKGTTTPKD
jgi:hypothetical protein